MNTTDSDNSSAAVEILPTEVWGRVFAYLASDDRRSVRRACRYLYDACNQVSIQRTEEFAFYDDVFDVGAALQCLSNTQRKSWSIKLSMVPFMNPSILSFFTTQGPNVHSLIIDKCVFEPGMLHDVIKYCVNLQNLVLIFDKPNYLISYDPMLELFISDFKCLRKNGIVRENVVSFTLKREPLKRHSYESMMYAHAKSDITNENLLIFFDVLPNIRDLNVTLTVDNEFNQFSAISTDIQSDKILSFSCIHYLISKMRHQLEKLKLGFVHSYFTYDYEPHSYVPSQLLAEISRIQMAKLKELSLNWIGLGDTLEINHCSSFQNLIHFDCYIESRMNVTASDFVQSLLNTALQLRILTVRSDEIFDMSRKCFQALVNSKLRTLNIFILTPLSQFSDNDRVRTKFCPFEESSLAPNYHLTHFRTNLFSSLSDELSLLLITYFRNLQNIEVNDFNENVLHNLIKYQSRLVRLTLSSHVLAPMYVSLQQWFQSGNLSSYRRRENLLHLHIREFTCLDLSPFILNEFVFPKLKTFTMDIGWSNKDDDYSYEETVCDIDLLWQNIRKLGQLECLVIKWRFEISVQQWLALVETLSKLRYVVIFNYCKSHELFEYQYRQLFQMNSSLRLLVHVGEFEALGWNDMKGVKFVRDGTNVIRKIVFRGNECDIFEGVPDHYFDEISFFKPLSSDRCLHPFSF